MDEEEMLDLLCTEGMLVKRPLLVTDQFVLFGFREQERELSLLDGHSSLAIRSKSS
jgi:arsenate reductase